MFVKAIRAIFVIGAFMIPAFMAPLEAKDTTHDVEQQRNAVPYMPN